MNSQGCSPRPPAGAPVPLVAFALIEGRFYRGGLSVDGGAAAQLVKSMIEKMSPQRRRYGTVPAIETSMGSASRALAMIQMRTIANAIDIYILDNRTLPESLDELTRPSGKSNGPYLEKVPLDPWREPYEYRILNPKTRGYQITSAGADKETGTEDDLVYPEKEPK